MLCGMYSIRYCRNKAKEEDKKRHLYITTHNTLLTRLFFNREAGVACWHTNNRDRSRHVWEMALESSSYDFEYRLAVVNIMTTINIRTDFERERETHIFIYT